MFSSCLKHFQKELFVIQADFMDQKYWGRNVLCLCSHERYILLLSGVSNNVKL